MAADWYYIGHYGQLGPLTREQMDELIDGGVIARDTYVWKAGMSQWVSADSVPELVQSFRALDAFATPPPMPGYAIPPTAPPAAMPTAPAPSYPVMPSPQPAYAPMPTQPYGSDYFRPMSYGVRSDKSRTLAGVLNIVLPGVGRMYLGYVATGVIQLVLTVCSAGVLWLWPIIDGILMLVGNLKHDGYGRVLTD
jgi:hypothetical protein